MTSAQHSSNRSSRTRDALLDAGIKLVAERPIDAIPIDDIVAKAGVAKGSFFNHFGDKEGFAIAMAREVRMEIEANITVTNHGLDNPLFRLANGMREATEYALTDQKRAMAAMRFAHTATSRSHPLNIGVRADIEACVESGVVRKETRTSGMLFWLGLCQATMANVLENNFSREEAARRLQEMLLLGLSGLGVQNDIATQIANDVSSRLAARDS